MAHFVLNRQKVLEQYKKLLPVADHISYSVKTNPLVADVLEQETSCFFSLHSLKGLKHVKDKGRVFYFPQGSDEKELKKALKQGVDKFVVDNEEDLEVLLPALDKKITLLLRMRLKEYTVQTGKRYVYGMFSKQVNELIPKLKDNGNIKALGIHMHRKTQNVSEWSIKEELEDSIDVWDDIDIVNVGGGLPAIYKNYRAENLNYILGQLKELREWLSQRDIKMIVEPGRFIAAPSIKLIAKVKAIYGSNVIVDCSIYNSSMDTFLENIRLLVEGEKERGEEYTVKGCTPDSRDIFRYKVFLDRPKKGDEIVFLNAGAYNFSTDFCFLPELETVFD